MTHHPKCECDLCFTAELERVADAYRDIRLANSPLATLPGWDIAARRFREEREMGKPPIDPDAEQLAYDVTEELARCAG